MRMLRNKTQFQLQPDFSNKFFETETEHEQQEDKDKEGMKLKLQAKDLKTWTKKDHSGCTKKQDAAIHELNDKFNYEISLDQRSPNSEI